MTVNSIRTPKLLGIALSLGIAALCVESAAAQLAEKKVITLAAARKMVAAAEAEAERNHWAGLPLPWSTTADGRS